MSRVLLFSPPRKVSAAGLSHRNPLPCDCRAYKIPAFPPSLGSGCVVP